MCRGMEFQSMTVLDINEYFRQFLFVAIWDSVEYLTPEASSKFVILTPTLKIAPSLTLLNRQVLVVAK